LPLTSLVISLTVFGTSSALYFTKSPRTYRTAIFIFAAALCGAVSMLAVGYIAHFRVLGRHLIPALPFVLLLVSLGLLHLWQSDKKLGQAVVLSLCLLLILASLSIRFSPRFAKDDYRTAAQIAKSGLENGKTIWWAADSATANYYGLEFSQKVINVMGLSAEELENIPTPDIVLVSKKDIYDPQNAISSFLSEQSYATTYTAAFSIYSK